MEDAREAEAAASATTHNPTGTLRVSASRSFSIQHIAPLLKEYTRQFPSVRSIPKSTSYVRQGAHLRRFSGGTF